MPDLIFPEKLQLLMITVALENMHRPAPFTAELLETVHRFRVMVVALEPYIDEIAPPKLVPVFPVITQSLSVTLAAPNSKP